MLVYIIILILLFALFPKTNNVKTENNLKKKEKVLKEINIEKLSVLTDKYLRNFNPNKDMAYFNLFNFLNQIVNKTKDISSNYVILTYNSYKLPEELIKVINNYQSKFQDLESIGMSVENEIKKFIINLNPDMNLDNFLKSFEFLSDIYYPSDEIVKLNVCNKEYIFSKRMNQVLTYFKSDEQVSTILFKYNTDYLKCNEII
jgi:hypothetical protein